MGIRFIFPKEVNEFLGREVKPNGRNEPMASSPGPSPPVEEREIHNSDSRSSKS
jgi:hypothetical protein